MDETKTNASAESGGLEHLQGQVMALTTVVRMLMAASPDGEWLREQIAEHTERQSASGLFRDTSESTLAGYDFALRLLRVAGERPSR
jgi:hypothetical protein